MDNKWIVVGISGATCSGKSTLAHKLHATFHQSVIICQDDYFFPLDSPSHVKVEALGHLNWEIMTALDMSTMRSDVHKILSQDPSCVVLPPKAKRSEEKISQIGMQRNSPFLLILEGFLLFNDQTLSNLCDLRYYLTLTRDQCWDRRRVRVYDPPDVPGYFDLVVWPEYLKNCDEVLSQGNTQVIDGMNQTEAIAQDVMKDIQNICLEKKVVIK